MYPISKLWLEAKSWDHVTDADVPHIFYPEELKALDLLDDIIRPEGAAKLSNLISRLGSEDSPYGEIVERIDAIALIPIHLIEKRTAESLARKLWNIAVALREDKVASNDPSTLSPEQREKLVKSINRRLGEEEWKLLQFYEKFQARSDVYGQTLLELVLDTANSKSLSQLDFRTKQLSRFQPLTLNEGIRNALVLKTRVLLQRPQINTEDQTLHRGISRRGEAAPASTDNPIYLVTGQNTLNLEIDEARWIQRVQQRFVDIPQAGLHAASGGSGGRTGSLSVSLSPLPTEGYTALPSSVEHFAGFNTIPGLTTMAFLRTGFARI